MNIKKLDLYSTKKILELINKEDKKVPILVGAHIAEIANVVDVIVGKIKSGGRLFYVGSGTSGRLGTLDASELSPTFSVKDGIVHALIAGGKKALCRAVEGAEDNVENAIFDLKNKKLSNKDVVIGISASGTTPYTICALLFSHNMGATTVGLFSTKKIKKSDFLDFLINVNTHQEVIEGSTRMKAGTAQKLILNMISSTVMIKLGKTYGNLMVDLQAKNEKLIKRAKNIIKRILPEFNELSIEKTLKKSGYSVKEAILILKRRITIKQAKMLLAKNGGNLRVCLKKEL